MCPALIFFDRDRMGREDIQKELLVKELLINKLLHEQLLRIFELSIDRSVFTTQMYALFVFMSAKSTILTDLLGNRHVEITNYYLLNYYVITLYSK